mmetsp:Transcript_21313/g.55620  ORF Transcript_21313/g.55620 Transcript_21313/m.55620 type:complete len:724 (-) Transcript_21313:138-2309(-)
MAQVASAAEEDEAMLKIRPVSIFEGPVIEGAFPARVGEAVSVAEVTVPVYSAARGDNFLDFCLGATQPNRVQIGRSADLTPPATPADARALDVAPDVTSIDGPTPPHFEVGGVVTLPSPPPSVGVVPEPIVMQPPPEPVLVQSVKGVQPQPPAPTAHQPSPEENETPLADGEVDGNWLQCDVPPDPDRPDSYINLTDTKHASREVRASLLQPFLSETSETLGNQYQLSADTGELEVWGAQRRNPLYAGSNRSSATSVMMSFAQLERESNDFSAADAAADPFDEDADADDVGVAPPSFVFVNHATSGGVRFAEGRNTHHVTWGDMDYDRGADYDMDAAMLLWELEREEETHRMLQDRWTYLESKMPPASIHPERAEFMRRHGLSATETGASEEAFTMRRDTGASVVSVSSNRMSRSDSVVRQRMSRASMLGVDLSMFDPASGEGEEAGVEIDRVKAQGATEARPSLSCDSEAAMGRARSVSQTSDIATLMEELESVRRASAAVDEQLAKVNASATPKGGATAAVLEEPETAPPTADSPEEPTSEPATGMDAELAALRAELEAVRAASAKMEAAMDERGNASLAPKYPAPPPPVGAAAGSPKLSRTPSRPAPPPPLAAAAAPSADAVFADDGALIFREDTDDEADSFEVMPLRDLAAQHIGEPLPILRTPPPTDETLQFPPTVWLDCILDAHAVEVANDLWGIEYADSSDEDDLLEMAIEAGVFC